jgi:hypothetical protein
MAFVNECSCPCPSAELDLFEVPPTQLTVESCSVSEYHPITSLNDGSTIEFEFKGTGDDYVDLKNSFLCVKAKITKPAGGNLDANEATAPVNNFLHSLFSQIDIYVNGTLVTSSTNTYPYRSIIETLLSYGEDAKNTHLSAAMYYKDRAGKMDSVDVDGADTNPGFIDRRLQASGSGIIDMMGRLHADLFFQDRYLLNGLDVKIRLTRSKDEFCLMSGNPRTVKIMAAKLLVRKVRVLPSVALGHEKALEVNAAKYPIKRVVCKTFTVPRDVRDVNQEKLFSGQLPSRLVIGLVDNEAFNGSLTRNPFNFEHFKMSELCVYMDGQQNHQIKPIRPDYPNKQFVEAYLSLFTGTNKINSDESNWIKLSEYPNGYCLYAFDLSPDLCEGQHFNLVKQGTVRLSMKFQEALVRAITAIVYAEFENVIEVNRSRNVILDY